MMGHQWVRLYALFGAARLREKLRHCFPARPNGSAFSVWRVVLSSVVHLMLGFRRLLESADYRKDPLVQRVLGLNTLPGERTLSRTLSKISLVEELQFDELVCELATDGLKRAKLSEVTLDFDGSVQSTGGYAKGTACGFNEKKTGDRSDYPLFATIGETSQFLAMHHRSGNVHDSSGACEFIDHCVDTVRAARSSSFTTDAAVRRSSSARRRSTPRLTSSRPNAWWPIDW